MADRDRWVAIDASTDPRRLARTLAQAHSDVLSGGAAGGEVVRDAISSSWDRSADAGVDPDGGGPPQAISSEEASSRWASHPLSMAEPILRELLADVRSDDDQVVLVCDADGKLLWIDGEPALLDAAQGVNLQPGADWGEAHAGTNAMGTALEVGHSIQVFSAEHFSRGVHEWTCSAAPVHDPDSGDVLGVIDLSGELKTAHPHSLALIEAAARVIEAKLGQLGARRDAVLLERFGDRIGPGLGKASALLAPSGRVVGSTAAGWSGLRLEVPEGGGMIEMGEGISVVAEPLPAADGFLLWRARDGRPSPDRTLRLKLLGDDRAEAGFDGRAEHLSPRHSEIVALLALGSPSGHAADARELAARLYGDEGKAGSVRVELSRLRGRLGDRLTSGTAALVGEVRSDYREVERLAGVGRLGEALDAYPGPLLPASRVPEIAERREALDNRLREAALASHGSSALTKWLDTPSGSDDIAACRELVKRLDDGDPARPSALSRLRRIANS